MPSTSATTDSSGSFQPSSALSRVPSGQDHSGWNCERVDGGDGDRGGEQSAVNFSCHSAYAVVCARREPAVDRGGLGQRVALGRSRAARARMSRVTAGSPVVRRAASSTSATSARQCGTVDLGGCSAQVIGWSRSPRPSSSRATASSWRATRSASTPVVGHHGRGVLQPAGRVGALDEVAQAGERRDVPAPAREGRREPLRCGAGARRRRPGRGTSCADRAPSARRPPPRRARRRRPSCRGRPPARPPGTRSVSVMRASARSAAAGGRRAGRPMSPCATRSAQRTSRSSSTEAWTAATVQQLAQLGGVEAGQQRQPQHQLALGQLELGPRDQPHDVRPGHPAVGVEDAAQRDALRLDSGRPERGGAARSGSGCSRSPPAAPTR